MLLRSLVSVSFVLCLAVAVRGTTGLIGVLNIVRSEAAWSRLKTAIPAPFWTKPVGGIGSTSTESMHRSKASPTGVRPETACVKRSTEKTSASIRSRSMAKAVIAAASMWETGTSTWIKFARGMDGTTRSMRTFANLPMPNAKPASTSAVYGRIDVPSNLGAIVTNTVRPSGSNATSASPSNRVHCILFNCHARRLRRACCFWQPLKTQSARILRPGFDRGPRGSRQAASRNSPA